MSNPTYQSINPLYKTYAPWQMTFGNFVCKNALFGNVSVFLSPTEAESREETPRVS